MELTPGHQKYAKFLEKHGISKAEAARAIGVTHGAVHQYLDGTSSPLPERRKAIEVWTGGEVAASDWLTDKEREALAQLGEVKPFAPKEPAA